MEVEAVPSGAGAWPSEKRIRLLPLATDDYTLASGGALELSGLERAPAYTCEKAGRPANRKKPTPQCADSLPVQSSPSPL